MKTIILIGLFQLLFISVKLDKLPHKNNLKVSYNQTFKKYKNSPRIRTSSVKLYITDTSSIFISDELETILLTDELGFDGLGLSDRQIHSAKERGSTIDYFVQKLYKTGKLTFSQEVKRQQFVGYSENMMLPNIWSLQKDSATISGLKCIKATCKMGGRDWIAWFTTEVPVRDGPYNFYGLPGLIVNLESADRDYVFEMTGVQKLEEGSFFPSPIPNTLVSRKRFLELQRNYGQMAMAKVKSYGGEHTYEKNGVIVPYSELENEIKKEDETRNEMELN